MIPALRACASCEWVFRLAAEVGICPKCGFGHYGARYTYGRRAYEYALTQKPWREKKLAKYAAELEREIASAQHGAAPRRDHQAAHKR